MVATTNYSSFSQSSLSPKIPLTSEDDYDINDLNGDAKNLLFKTRTTGQRRLETTNGVFIPGAYERVLEVPVFVDENKRFFSVG